MSRALIITFPTPAVSAPHTPSAAEETKAFIDAGGGSARRRRRCRMSAMTRRPGQRLIPDDAPVKTPRRATRPDVPALPRKGIAEAFEIMAVLDPKLYRIACGLVIGDARSGIGFAAAWAKATPEQQRAAAAEADRRREAVKDRPGRTLI